MVDSGYSPDSYNTVKINISVILTNPEMLKFIPDHLKVKKIFRSPVKKWPFVRMYVLD